MKSTTSTGIIEFGVYGVEAAKCDPTIINQYVNKNSGTDTSANYVKATVGDKVQFKPGVAGGVGSKYQWSGPKNFKSSNLTLTLSNLQESQSGTYTFIYINGCGAETRKYFFLTVLGSEGHTYTEWPKYNPTLNYDFRKLYPNFPMPTKNLEDSCSGFAWNISDRWWNFVAGKKAKSLVTAIFVI